MFELCIFEFFSSCCRLFTQHLRNTLVNLTALAIYQGLGSRRYIPTDKKKSPVKNTFTKNGKLLRDNGLITWQEARKKWRLEFRNKRTNVTSSVCRPRLHYSELCGIIYTRFKHSWLNILLSIYNFNVKDNLAGTLCKVVLKSASGEREK